MSNRQYMDCYSDCRRDGKHTQMWGCVLREPATARPIDHANDLATAIVLALKRDLPRNVREALIPYTGTVARIAALAALEYFKEDVSYPFK